MPGKDLAPREVDEMTIRDFFPTSEHPAPAVSPTEEGFGQEAEVEDWEIDRALEKRSHKSAPGPDQIPYIVWKKIHKENHKIIPWLMSNLLKWSTYPEILKYSWGILLPKQGKTEYKSPKNFQVIALMQTFRKILERLVARRLAKLAWNGAYKREQMCSVAGRSCSDAAMALYQRVTEYQFSGKKVSSMFLDIKGGFDHVRHDELIRMLKRKRCPDYLTSWISNFIAYRLCTLLFPGWPKKTHRINTGIPQGSPLSPLLFVT